MPKSKLDVYKDHYGYELDGEAILRAAEMGEFSEEPDYRQSIEATKGVAARRLPADHILRALGIQPGMQKRIILGKLKDIKVLKDQKQFLALVEEEALKIRGQASELLRNIHPLPSVKDTYIEDTIREVVRNRILAVITQVIDFCEGMYKENADED